MHIFDRFIEFINHPDHAQYDATIVAMLFFGAGIFVIVMMYVLASVTKACESVAPVLGPQAQVTRIAAPVYAPMVYAQPAPSYNPSSAPASFGRPRDLTEGTY